MHLRLPAVFTCLCIATLLPACSKHSVPDSAAISGTLSYRAPVAFDAPATLQLQLTDVSALGAAPEIASVTIDGIQALPYQYTLTYDRARIDTTHRYTLSARVYSGQQLRYATDTPIAVLTQGAGAFANVPLVAAGKNEAPSGVAATSSSAPPDILENQLRNGQEVTRYRAGFVNDRLAWLEEDRSTDTPRPFHARYEFRGALLLHYVDGAGFAFDCNDNGRPLSASRNGRRTDLTQERNAINVARNRAALLRSHALSAREIQVHRAATKQDIGA